MRKKTENTYPIRLDLHTHDVFKILEEKTTDLHFYGVPFEYLVS